MFNNVIIIGKGLVGGSIGKRLALHKCQVNYIDLEEGNYSAIPSADLIVIATPVLSIPTILKKCINSQAIIMDVASTKTFVLEQAKSILGVGFARFVGTHPIAGKEISGFVAADANLFVGKPVVLTPSDETNKEALIAVKKIWQLLGAHIYEMTATEHDLAFAKYSHLSNIVSFLLQHQSMNPPLLAQELLPPSFKDMTRLAASDPAMWRDICLSNQEAILANLNSFIAEAIQFQTFLQQKNSEALLAFFHKK